MSVERIVLTVGCDICGAEGSVDIPLDGTSVEKARDAAMLELISCGWEFNRGWDSDSFDACPACRGKAGGKE